GAGAMVGDDEAGAATPAAGVSAELLGRDAVGGVTLRVGAGDLHRHRAGLRRSAGVAAGMSPDATHYQGWKGPSPGRTSRRRPPAPPRRRHAGPARVTEPGESPRRAVPPRPRRPSLSRGWPPPAVRPGEARGCPVSRDACGGSAPARGAGGHNDRRTRPLPPVSSGRVLVARI